MIESRYTQAIHKKLPPKIYKWKVGDKLVGGVPDAFYRNLESKRGKPLWVEYKLIKQLPARDDTVVRPNLSAQQDLWLRDAQRAGENAIVILGCMTMTVGRSVGSFVFENPEQWNTGISAAKLKSATWLSYSDVADLISEKTC